MPCVRKPKFRPMHKSWRKGSTMTEKELKWKIANTPFYGALNEAAKIAAIRKENISERRAEYDGLTEMFEKHEIDGIRKDATVMATYRKLIAKHSKKKSRRLAPSRRDEERRERAEDKEIRRGEEMFSKLRKKRIARDRADLEGRGMMEPPSQETYRRRESAVGMEFPVKARSRAKKTVFYVDHEVGHWRGEGKIKATSAKEARELFQKRNPNAKIRKVSTKGTEGLW